MKKSLIALCCVFLAVLLALPAMAAEEGQFEDGFDVLEYWNEHGIPDYVTGIWATDGGYMVGLVEGPVGEAAKEQILASMKKDIYLLFTYQTYSLLELEQVMDELRPYFDREWGICSAGIHQQGNVVTVGIDPENPMAEELAAELTAKYGDKIEVREGAPIVLLTGKDAVTPADKAGMTPGQVALMVSVMGGLVLFGFFFGAVYRRRGIQTADGRVITQDTPLSRKATVAAVKETEEYPDTTLRDIVEKLEQ